MITLNELAQKLLREKNVAIICHIRPDGDALGSACALKNALISKGIRADAFCSDAVPEKFWFLEDTKSVIQKYNGDFKEYSAVCGVDNADITRFGDFAEAFARHKNTYNIDHHISNGNYAKINFVKERASNSENVFALLKEMKVNIDAETANLLAMGVMLDTGGFRHKNVTSETFKDAGELVSLGADMDNIYFYTFTRQTKARAELFGKTMARLRYFADGKIALASVRLKDIEESGAKQEDTEGFIDFVMGIIGVEVGICLMETETNKYKVSFRSKKADVNAVAGIFGGGGHKLASGCRIYGEYEEVVDKLTVAVKKYIDD